MRTLETHEQLRRAEAAGREVFRSFDVGTSHPFRDSIEARLLVYPIDYTMLAPEQFGAVAAAAAIVGDKTAYFAAYGNPEADWRGTSEHGVVALGDFLDYKPERNALILEHLLYSPQGAWGLATSDGEYAVVGGSHDFVDTLRHHLPQREDEAVKAFVRDWTEIGRGDGAGWLRPLIEHVYGEARAARMWDEE
jgi:hypothetical protein